MNHLCSTLTIALMVFMVAAPTQAQDPEGKIITVTMVDKSTNEWRFEPEAVTVHYGDTIRWIQDDIAPHNIQFKEWPSESQMEEIEMGPFLLTKGESYELKIDERFQPGEYLYVCTPHAPMGMKASILVMMSHFQEDQ